MHKGQQMPQETKDRIRISNLGRKVSEETRKRLRESHLGQRAWNKGLKGVYVPTEETRKKMSESIRGEKHPNYGRKWSLEIREKMGAGQRGKKRPHSEEHKKAIAKALTGVKKPNNTGSKHPNWKGGITTQDKKDRKSIETKQWRKAVFERDNYTCVWCDARSGVGNSVIIQADHIKPWAYFPELRFVLSNGRTLCISCHRKTDTFAGKAKKHAGIFL